MGSNNSIGVSYPGGGVVRGGGGGGAGVGGSYPIGFLLHVYDLSCKTLYRKQLVTRILLVQVQSFFVD